MGWSQIRVDSEVRAELESRGKYNDTMNSILRRLLVMPEKVALKPGPKAKEVISTLSIPTKRAAK